MWYFYIFFLGLIIGSFANVVIYRVPCGKSVAAGRSKCANCGKKIAWYDLIPIISFFILKFRCRQCHKPISWIYPAVELYSGIFFLLTFKFLGANGIISWLFAVFILEVLLILALIDLENLILPDSVMLTAFLGVVIFGAWEYLSGNGVFNIFSLNNLAGAAVLFSAFFLLWFWSKGLWLGLGDAKLAGLMGLILGLWGGLVVIYGAIIAGTVAGLFLLARSAPVWMAQNWGWTSRKANLKTKLPLGTFICFSATVYFFVGAAIQDRLADFFYTVPLILR